MLCLWFLACVNTHTHFCHEQALEMCQGSIRIHAQPFVWWLSPKPIFLTTSECLREKKHLLPCGCDCTGALVILVSISACSVCFSAAVCVSPYITHAIYIYIFVQKLQCPGIIFVLPSALTVKVRLFSKGICHQRALWSLQNTVVFRQRLYCHQVALQEDVRAAQPGAADTLQFVPGICGTQK